MHITFLFRLQTSIPNRALDIGCAVGASTLEMTKAFDSVVGIDYSQAFIDACNTMKGQGMMKYSMVREGEICDEFVAQVESELVSTKHSDNKMNTEISHCKHTF